MARVAKYEAEFKADAIALWRSGGGARTFKDVADGLNVNPETLRSWVLDAEGRLGRDGRVAPVSAAPGGMEAEVVRLPAENARLAKAERE